MPQRRLAHRTIVRWRALALRAACLVAVATALGGCGPCGAPWWGKSQIGACQSDPQPQ
jgi:hypothetical protein